MATIQAFDSAIARIRDILRSVGITGMSSMQHVCIYMISRYLTRDKVVAIGLPDKYCWESITDLIDKAEGGLDKALELFNNPLVDDKLISRLDVLFGTQKFDFDIKNKNVHKEILDIFRSIDIDALDNQIDILGRVYEIHLGTGSNTPRDLGQFFTDRAVCRYMTELCAPKFKTPGVPETVCDPTMGTGGFLTAYIKYFKRVFAAEPVNWRVQLKEVFGCDTDARVAGVARMNIFIETGGNRAPDGNLDTRDSLRQGLQRTGYDVILANMPFGIKGLTHATCCKAIKDLHISDSKKSEQLFLQLMMNSLNEGGRCAVVVPDGVLMNVTKGFNLTRKYLIEELELRKVIKMNGDFFLNTGIKPSILYFANSGCATGDIEFCEITKNTAGEIVEKQIAIIPVENLDANYSLDVRKYLTPIDQPIAINGHEMMQLSDVLTIVGGKSNTDRNDHLTIPYFDTNGISGYVEQPLYTGQYVITARKLSIGSSHYIDGPFWVSDNTINFTTKDDTRLSTKFFYYWLKFNNHLLLALSSGIKPGIRKSDVEKIRMPIPPREIQQHVVEALDNISATIDDATRMIRAIKDQMESIIMSSFHHSTMCKVRDVAMSCSERPKTILDPICYVDLTSVKQGILNMRTIPLSERPSSATKCARVGDIIWGKCRPLSRSYAFIEQVPDNMILSSAFVVIRVTKTETILPKYLYFAITTTKCVQYLQNRSTGALYPNFNVDTLLDYPISIPPLNIQQSIVERMNASQEHIQRQSQLRAQSENNARFILESYLSNHESIEQQRQQGQQWQSIDDTYDPELDDGQIDTSGASSSGTSHGDTDDEDDEA